MLELLLSIFLFGCDKTNSNCWQQKSCHCWWPAQLLAICCCLAGASWWQWWQLVTGAAVKLASQ